MAVSSSSSLAQNPFSCSQACFYYAVSNYSPQELQIGDPLASLALRLKDVVLVLQRSTAGVWTKALILDLQSIMLSCVLAFSILMIGYLV